MVGQLDPDFEAMPLPSEPCRGLQLNVYTAAAGTPTADGLKLLASWAASQENLLSRGKWRPPSADPRHCGLTYRHILELVAGPTRNMNPWRKRLFVATSVVTADAAWLFRPSIRPDDRRRLAHAGLTTRPGSTTSRYDGR